MGRKSDIIDRNLELMLSLKDCGMMKLMNAESVGARGYVVLDGRRCPQMFANFYYDGETGEIICFSNRDPALKDKARGRFTIASDFKRENPYFRIVNVVFDEKASDNANAVIMSCVNLYNSTYEQVGKKAA
ncbi:hypothetical protein KY338_02435 [Candidatus Woesearchaeota archaeon]|nr:hypothetical protein [Candidatus Woesearchaeota archaeon]MBW3005926.1 hypothetical protein [Candidatus Woesearchaeota archaeon]